ncbi:MAG: polysaccharide deacetylase family protein, partial [Armatimonadota bacterium]
MRHALTIDTEDWPALMCSYLGRRTRVSGQFARSVHRALDLLDEYQTRATFFVLASQAAEEPEPIREIADRGHEIASHGWTHAKLKA